MPWIEYFSKWFLAATPIPVRIVEVIFLVLAILGMAAREIKPEWMPRMDKLAWQLPLGVLIVTFFVSLAVSSYNIYKEQGKEIINLTNQLEIASKQAYPPITTLMMQDHFKNKDIPLGQFALYVSKLNNKTFENCVIHGPLVVFLAGDITIVNSKFDEPVESVCIITKNKSVTGILAIDNCKFIECDFKQISFIGNEKHIEKLKNLFSKRDN